MCSSAAAADAAAFAAGDDDFDSADSAVDAEWTRMS